MEIGIKTIEQEDPTALKVFVAEYHFLKKDMEKAFRLFSEAYADPGLSPVMKRTVRKYLVLAAREMRVREIDGMDFTISFNFRTQDGAEQHFVITRDTFNSQTQPIGMLLEVVDYFLKKDQAGN